MSRRGLIVSVSVFCFSVTHHTSVASARKRVREHKISIGDNFLNRCSSVKKITQRNAPVGRFGCDSSAVIARSTCDDLSAEARRAKAEAIHLAFLPYGLLRLRS